MAANKSPHNPRRRGEPMSVNGIEIALDRGQGVSNDYDSINGDELRQVCARQSS